MEIDQSLESEKLKIQFKVWKAALESQMHFNDLVVKARQLCFSVIAILLGAIFYSARDTSAHSFIYLKYLGGIHVAFFLTLIIILLVLFLRRIEIVILHPMLQGAVYFSVNYEKYVLKKTIFNDHNGLSQSILLYSQYPNDQKSSDEKYLDDNFESETVKSSLSNKIKNTYCWTISVLIIIAILMWFIEPTQLV